MDYNLRIGGLTRGIVCDIRDDGTLSARVDGELFEVRYRVISSNQIHLEIDGAGYNVYLADDPTGRIINLGGTSYLVQDADSLAQGRSRRRGPLEIPQEVTPPMPSVVVRILVAAGDPVEKGQGVVVVSAMKMETTLMAPFGGRVHSINVKEGDKVMPGQILVDIEKQEEEVTACQEELSR